jgi:hypothetical protein
VLDEESNGHGGSDDGWRSRAALATESSALRADEASRHLSQEAHVHNPVAGRLNHRIARARGKKLILGAERIEADGALPPFLIGLLTACVQNATDWRPFHHVVELQPMRLRHVSIRKWASLATARVAMNATVACTHECCCGVLVLLRKASL